MAPTPGILYVTMQPRPSLPAAQFQDWYNNEHGPNRLRLSCVENGLRYRATDLEGQGKGLPEWMAIYDITDMAELTKETYLSLRTVEVQSQRERDTMKQITVDRRLYDLVYSRASAEFKQLEEAKAEGEKNVLVTVNLTIHPGKEAELKKWYEEEHIEMVSKIPGWRRSRRFVTSTIDPKGAVEHLGIHEYSPANGLGGKEHVASMTTAWAEEIIQTVLVGMGRRLYELYYTFGAAPRELEALSSADAVPFTSTDGLTKTIPSLESGIIESYVTTADGVALPFRLEGSSSPTAPCIVLCNSILVTYSIWDAFVAAFLSKQTKYRVLRYQSRGRSSACGSQPITVDLLASDIIALLDALRISKAALVGVSLGGATVLNAALRYPDRIAAFVACDTSAKSPAGNAKAWSERIAVAESEGAKSTSATEGGIVGDKLAEMTVRRWFVPESYDGGDIEKVVERVKEMVRTNSLEGFKRSVQALWEYDMTSLLKGCSVKGLLVVGGGDGVLPEAMKRLAKEIGTEGVECMVVEGAGHLPMVEKGEEVARVVGRFLGE